MVFQVRRAGDRGRADYGWLKTKHSFSFANYYDPNHMGFRALRVINEDIVSPGRGFGAHSHRDMEIVSYVLSGALEHKDSLGTTSVIRAGEIQRMTAGSGITHSEYNHSKVDPVKFMQIWIEPERRSLDPGYEQKHIESEIRERQEDEFLTLIASRSGQQASLKIHADVNISLLSLEPGEKYSLDLAAGRHTWLQLLEGSALEIRTEEDFVELNQGDGLGINNLISLELKNNGQEAISALVFDLS